MPMLLVLLLLSVSGWAQTARSNFIFAYSNLEHFISICLNDKKCDLDNEQKELLTKISQSLPSEKKNKKQLTFASEKEQPGLFIIDGNPKAAKTFDDVGSLVYINTDMITQNQQPMSVMEALAILTHEMGHHHQEKREDFLDLLGFQVAHYYHQNLLQTAYHFIVPELSVSGFNFWKKVSVNSVFRSHADFDFILSDQQVFEDLSAQFSQFTCVAPENVDCEDAPRKIASNVQNFFWQDETTLKGQIVYICECSRNSLKNLFSRPRNFDLTIKLQTLNNKQTYLPQSASVRIYQ